MTAYIRVFAGELSCTSLQQPAGYKHAPVIIITPSGATGSTLFLAGALTRVEKQPGGFLQVWIADPTGIFNLSVGKQEEEICAFLEKADIPVFVSVTGELQITRGRNKEVAVRPLTIRTVDKVVRDSWIIRTAEETLKRLEFMEKTIGSGTPDQVIQHAVDHYSLGSHQIKTLVAMVEKALSKAGYIPGGTIELPDPREILLELITTHSGPRGIHISELVPLAAGKGIREDQVISTVRQLVEEDECYQPAAGAVKLL
jgi:uncharacterized protein